MKHTLDADRYKNLTFFHTLAMTTEGVGKSLLVETTGLKSVYVVVSFDKNREQIEKIRTKKIAEAVAAYNKI